MNRRQNKRHKDKQSLTYLKLKFMREIRALMKRFPYRSIEDLIAYHIVRTGNAISVRVNGTYLKQLPVPRRKYNG